MAQTLKELEGVTWQNLSATFREVLAERMGKPRIADVHDIPELKKTIVEEDGLTTLAEHWNEPIVEHALDGTHERLCAMYPEGSLCSGKLHFMKNDGRGHVQDKNGNNHKPDWCVFQEQVSGDVKLDVKLVFGDTKPARKFRSRYIKETGASQHRESFYPLEQITKYMWLGKTRYGFLLTEEELVLVRLSLTKKAAIDADVEEEEESQEQMLNESMGVGLQSQPDPETTIDFSSMSRSRPSDLYAGSDDAVWTVLEWSRIPWSSSGPDKMTVNLGLWWWPVLAIQSCSIKDGSKYTGLGERRRGHSPEFELPQLATPVPAVPEDEPHRSSSKQELAEMHVAEQGPRRSKRQRSSPSYIEIDDSPPRRRRKSTATSTSYVLNSPVRAAATPSRTETGTTRPGTPYLNSPSFHRSWRPRRRATSGASSNATTVSSQRNDPLFTSFQSVSSQT